MLSTSGLIWNKLWPDLEGEQDINADQREEITDFDQSIPRFKECDEDIETSEDCGFQMPNDDDIVTSVLKSDPVDSERDEYEDNNNEGSKGPSRGDAFSPLETALEWYELQLECCPTQLLLLKRE
ncbi:hypothetical protein TNCV_185671 [Trichonephila clavipes]|nr:hypothetical protein TNCV_185671 [Trichonephila clavipes]